MGNIAVSILMTLAICAGIAVMVLLPLGLVIALLGSLWPKPKTA